MRPLILTCLTAACLAAAAPGRAAEADSQVTVAEEALRDAKVGTDGPSLVKFFRQRTLSEADRKKLADKVPLLGDDNFQVRRRAYRALLVGGWASLRYLRPALKSTDAEIARSAKKLVARIEGGAEAAVIEAATRVIAVRKPAGATEALLAFLPMTGDENIEEAVLKSLAVVGLQGGKVKAALAEALKAKDPMRRWAASYVYARGGPEQRKALAPLLTDPDVRVRFQAATALTRAGEKKAVAALIGLLAKTPDSLAFRVEDLLYRIAGDKSPQATLGTTAAERKKCRDAWAGWWKANEAKVDLAKLNLKKLLRGITLVCECGAGKHPTGYVWAYRAGGKPLLEFDNINTPCDVQLLPNNHILVAPYSGNDVTERDRKGKVLWTHRVQGQARSCQRLPNGNTFIATTLGVLEVTRAGKVVYSYQKPEGIYRARKLRNGKILYISMRGRVVLLGAGGKELKSVNVPGGVPSYGDVELLPNGRFLVCCYGSNKVMELDAAGKAVWQITVTSPSSVNRLPNGNTLVTAMNAKCVVEYNRAGKQVAKQDTPGRPFCVRRY
jgi:hypothetical protein